MGELPFPNVRLFGMTKLAWGAQWLVGELIWRDAKH